MEVEGAGGPGSPSHPLASQLLPPLPQGLHPAVTLAIWLLPTVPLPVTQGRILGHPPWTGAEPRTPTCSQKMSPGQASLGTGEKWPMLPLRSRGLEGPRVGAHVDTGLGVLCMLFA